MYSVNLHSLLQVSLLCYGTLQLTSQISFHAEYVAGAVVVADVIIATIPPLANVYESQPLVILKTDSSLKAYALQGQPAGDGLGRSEMVTAHGLP